MEIVENNKLIAEFMGGVVIDKRYTVNTEYRFNTPIRKVLEDDGVMNQTYLEDSYECPAVELEYNSSWDWLMSVVEEISTNHYSGVSIMRRVTHIRPDEELEFTGTGDSMIEATYKSVIKFINWYNLNK